MESDFPIFLPRGLLTTTNFLSVRAMYEDIIRFWILDLELHPYPQAKTEDKPNEIRIKSR